MNLRYSLLIFSLFLSFCVKGQWGESDTTFNTIDKGFGYGDGFNNGMNALAQQPDGKLIMVSHSYLYNSALHVRIVRTDSTGLADSTFKTGSGFNFAARSVAIQNDGKILIGGDFTTYNGKTARYLIRLLSNGEMDTTFKMGTGFASGPINSIIILPNSQMLVGGGFWSYNGKAIRSVARLNNNGSLDTTFFSGISGTVHDMTMDNKGRILTVGNISKFGNNLAHKRIARLNTNGSLDTTFKTGTGFSHITSCVEIDKDGKILIGGDFRTFNGSSVIRIARLDSNGSLDTTLKTGVGFDRDVYSLHITSDSTFLVGGRFQKYNAANHRSLIELKYNGTLNKSFSSEKIIGAVQVIEKTSRGKFMIGGAFTSIGSVYRFYIARLNQDYTHDLTFNSPTGLNFNVHAVAIHQNNKILVGGEFSAANGIPKNALVRLLPNGTVDTTFKSGSGCTRGTGTAGDVRVIVVQRNHKILVGGYFTEYNGTSVDRLIRLNSNGTLDNTFSSSVSYTPYSVAVDDSNRILVGRNNGLARLKSNGSTDNSFSQRSGLNGEVNSIVVQRDFKIIVGGGFTSFGGSNRNRIVRLENNGSVDVSFNPGLGFNGKVSAVGLQKDGHIIVGGAGFTSFNGVTRNNIARLEDDGSLDTNFRPGKGIPSVNRVWSIIAQKDDDVIVAGQIFSYDKDTVGNILKIDKWGKLDTNFYNTYKFEDYVKSVALQDGHEIIAGGFFNGYEDHGRNRLARITNCVSSEEFLIDTVCSGTYSYNGKSYSTSVLDTHNFTNSRGCDSTILLVLHFGSTKIDTSTFAACDTFFWAVDSITYSQSGLYLDTISDTYGCDSIVLLDLTINKSTIDTLNISACNSYYWSVDSTLYLQSGFYIDTLTTKGGCDSVINLNLTVNYNDSTLIPVTACDSYYWPISKSTYFQSGNYRDTVLTQFGCDSIVKLNLTINKSDSAHQKITACNTYSWTANSNTYSISGFYMDTILTSKGCDSIVTLDLTINKSSSSNVSKTNCEQYFWPLNNQTYTSSGNYQHTINGSNGCDSTINLKLTINKGTSKTENIQACSNYFWSANNTNYKKSGLYSVTLTNIQGCDSILKINLTVDSADISVSKSEHILSAGASNATFQWLNCDNAFSIILNETKQIFEPTKNGNYAVEVSQRNCVDTSECISITEVGLSDNSSNGQNLKVYPNPTIDFLTVEFHGNLTKTSRYEITTLDGKMLISGQLQINGITIINLKELENGVYLFVTKNIENEIAPVRIIKM